jgi:hypothetical protein
MMGKASRDKGKRGELRAVKLLQHIYPKAERSANQSSGASEPDIRGTPWWLETKEEGRHNIWAAVRQAITERDAAGDTRPVLVLSKRTRGMYLAAMPVGDFIDQFGIQALNMSGPAHVTGVRIRWEALVKAEAALTVKLADREPPLTVFVARATDFVTELLENRR